MIGAGLGCSGGDSCVMAASASSACPYSQSYTLCMLQLSMTFVLELPVDVLTRICHVKIAVKLMNLTVRREKPYECI